VRIVHLTPHLPPDQAANALLPYQLGEWAAARGDTVLYVAHPPRAGGSAALPGDVTWVPRRQPSVWQKTVRVGSFAAAARIWRAAAPRIASADVVHIHSNGLLAEVGASIALRLGKPYVLALYGTEIWHYQARRGLDLFTRAYRGAAAVVFYSERLLLRARELAYPIEKARIHLALCDARLAVDLEAARVLAPSLQGQGSSEVGIDRYKFWRMPIQ